MLIIIRIMITIIPIVIIIIMIITIICIVKLGLFRNMFRAFLQHCVGHFCQIQRIIPSTTRHGSEVGYISFNSNIS